MAINDPTRIREFISFGLGNYSTEVASIIKNIWGKGFSVNITEYQGDSSTTKWDKSRVKIRIFRQRKDLYVIWDLLHEYGHILDGPPPRLTREVRLSREFKAWRLAEEELKLYPQLLPHYGEFIHYKETCLKTYGISDRENI